MTTYTFQEHTLADESYILVSQSDHWKKINESYYVKFRCAYVGTIKIGDVGIYLDADSTQIITGPIKLVKELANDPHTGQKIYELTLYDYGYNLKDGNLNEVFTNVYLEDIIESIVEANGLTFVNNLSSASGILVPLKFYRDINPIDAVNDICNILSANWKIQNTNFILYRTNQYTAPFRIDGTVDWVLPAGWEDDTSKQATKVIVKGGTITQRTSETLTGTGTVFTTTFTPDNVQISGKQQTTSSIAGDYTVDAPNKTITFNVPQTNPTVSYSYDSQIRVEVGDGTVVQTIEKTYIQTITEARTFGRKWLQIYQDGTQTGIWQTNNFFNYDVTTIAPGDTIQVKNRLNPSRDGYYTITKIERKYPQTLILTVGEDTVSLLNWQGEAKDRLKQLFQVTDNANFVQKDVYFTGSLDMGINAALTSLFLVYDNGEVLFASDTTLSSNGDLISDYGIYEDFTTTTYKDAANTTATWIGGTLTF